MYALFSLRFAKTEGRLRLGKLQINLRFLSACTTFVLMLLKSLHSLGKYLLLMGRTFTRPQRSRIFWQQYVREFYQLGYNSLFIVILMSFFIGALLCVQIKLNIWSPWMPRFTIG